MLGLTPSSLATSETVFEPRAIRRLTASFLNESGRFFLYCIGGTPRRIIPSGMSTKAGQAQTDKFDCCNALLGRGRHCQQSARIDARKVADGNQREGAR